jgi:hypothetical protein
MTQTSIKKGLRNIYRLKTTAWGLAGTPRGKKSGELAKAVKRTYHTDV